MTTFAFTPPINLLPSLYQTPTTWRMACAQYGIKPQPTRPTRQALPPHLITQNNAGSPLGAQKSLSLEYALATRIHRIPPIQHQLSPSDHIPPVAAAITIDSVHNVVIKNRKASLTVIEVIIENNETFFAVTITFSDGLTNNDLITLEDLSSFKEAYNKLQMQEPEDHSTLEHEQALRLDKDFEVARTLTHTIDKTGTVIERLTDNKDFALLRVTWPGVGTVLVKNDSDYRTTRAQIFLENDDMNLTLYKIEFRAGLDCVPFDIDGSTTHCFKTSIVSNKILLVLRDKQGNPINAILIDPLQIGDSKSIETNYSINQLIHPENNTPPLNATITYKSNADNHYYSGTLTNDPTKGFYVILDTKQNTPLRGSGSVYMNLFDSTNNKLLLRITVGFVENGIVTRFYNFFKQIF